MAKGQTRLTFGYGLLAAENPLVKTAVVNYVSALFSYNNSNIHERTNVHKEPLVRSIVHILISMTERMNVHYFSVHSQLCSFIITVPLYLIRI